MKSTLKFLSYPLSVLFYLCFGLTITIFHPVQWICLNIFGYQAHKNSVDILNWFLLRCMNIMGTTFHVTISTEIPKNAPIIIVSNHQSMWDIPPIIWFLRKTHPKFISKKELGKGIPSISFNLKYGGSILIDRKNRRESIQKMLQFSDYLNKTNRAGVIFPEGTRSRDGIPKPFKKSGLETLFKKIPSGYVIPVTINNSWKLQKWGLFPIPIGTRVEMTVHQAIKIGKFESGALIDEVEAIIVSKINNRDEPNY